MGYVPAELEFEPRGRGYGRIVGLLLMKTMRILSQWGPFQGSVRIVGS